MNLYQLVEITNASLGSWHTLIITVDNALVEVEKERMRGTSRQDSLKKRVHITGEGEKEWKLREELWFIIPAVA